SLPQGASEVGKPERGPVLSGNGLLSTLQTQPGSGDGHEIRTAGVSRAPRDRSGISRNRRGEGRGGHPRSVDGRTAPLARTHPMPEDGRAGRSRPRVLADDESPQLPGNKSWGMSAAAKIGSRQA